MAHYQELIRDNLHQTYSRSVGVTCPSDRILPYELVEPIRFSRLGALQIPIAEGSSGISAREASYSRSLFA
ncbi:hypothetical protein [Nostoc edaphicum]|uniref:hypothetical protein n=1 Tax=Nostoc edaphicum TaxID=264686 RepID=UPI001D1471F4|nr:hypothetical protein [Nostoc edaphicum]